MWTIAQGKCEEVWVALGAAWGECGERRGVGGLERRAAAGGGSWSPVSCCEPQNLVPSDLLPSAVSLRLSHSAEVSRVSPFYVPLPALSTNQYLLQFLSDYDLTIKSPEGVWKRIAFRIRSLSWRTTIFMPSSKDNSGFSSMFTLAEGYTKIEFLAHRYLSITSMPHLPSLTSSGIRRFHAIIQLFKVKNYF